MAGLSGESSSPDHGGLPQAADVAGRIPPCTVPLDDLVALAQLLSCRRIDDTGGMAFLESADSLKLWQTLKAKYPDMAVLQLKRAN